MSTPASTARRAAAALAFSLLVATPTASAALQPSAAIESGRVQTGDEEPVLRDRECAGTPNVVYTNNDSSPRTLTVVGDCEADLVRQSVRDAGVGVGPFEDQNPLARDLESFTAAVLPDDVVVKGEQDHSKPACAQVPRVEYHNESERLFPAEQGAHLSAGDECVVSAPPKHEATTRGVVERLPTDVCVSSYPEGPYRTGSTDSRPCR